ncbi:MAG: hypothetical protein SGI99_00695 [Pseudomonadota bacterium]|nr:hypothetical protein [Pseudomonadota bacterium]
MARILIVWELGGGLGHALPLRALADRLQQRGHEVVVAARDLLRLQRAFDGSAHTLVSTPFFPGLLQQPRQMNALSDVLWFESGGHSAETVQAQFRAWRGLLKLVRPDLIVTDAAPMTLAATQGLAPRLNYDGYFHATDACAWSMFRDWERADAGATSERAVRLLDHVNLARSRCGLALAADLPEAFAASRQLLRCLPELDPFGPRTAVRYIGHQAVGGDKPDWPGVVDAKRAFVYLRPEYAHAERLLGALARQQALSILCFVGLSDSAKLPQAAHIRYCPQPIDLNQALVHANLVICHGGGLHGLATQFGKPTLLMPLHTEHFLTSRMGERLGTSLVVMPPLTSADFLTPMRRLLTEPSFTRQAERVAACHRERVFEPLSTLLAEVDDLLAA